MNYTIRTIAAILLTALTATTLQAQPPAEGPAPRRGMRNMTPEQRAERQAILMAETLELDEEMQGEVQAVLLVYARKMQEARQGATDIAAVRETMRSLRKAQDEELQAMLTEEQWTAWEAKRAELRSRRPGSRDRR